MSYRAEIIIRGDVPEGIFDRVADLLYGELSDDQVEITVIRTDEEGEDDQ
jgi:hypothetical protein